MQADRHQVRGRLGEGPGEAEVLAHGEAERARQPGLQGGDADLAVALHPVAVARVKTGAGIVDRQVEGGADLEFLVVHVAAEPPRDRGADAAPGGGRGRAHDAEERVEGKFRAPGQHRDAPRHVDVRVDGLVIRELVRQRAEQRQDRHEAPIHAELQVEDVDLQHVAGLGPAHVDRPRDEVGAGALRQRVEGAAVILRHPDRIGMEGFASAGRERVQRHGIAGGDLQDGRQRGVEIAQHHALGGRGDLVMRGHAGSFGFRVRRRCAARRPRGSDPRPSPARPRSRARARRRRRRGGSRNRGIARRGAR